MITYCCYDDFFWPYYNMVIIDDFEPYIKTPENLYNVKRKNVRNKPYAYIMAKSGFV